MAKAEVLYFDGSLTKFLLFDVSKFASPSLSLHVATLVYFSAIMTLCGRERCMLNAVYEVT